MVASAAARWSEMLAALAIPPDILARAPESPYGFPVEPFARAARVVTRDTPSLRLAAAALPLGGTVLDVGCGAGAASLPLATQAGRLTGVDESAAMLDAFDRLCTTAGVAHTTVQGRWPDVAGLVVPADVVVCNHVIYNVTDLTEFAVALTTHARSLVVVELTSSHPLAWLAPLWRDLHGADRPDGPRAQDALAVLAELGLRTAVEKSQTSLPLADVDETEQVAFVRRRLCLSQERDREIRSALARHPVPATRTVVTVSW